MKKSSAVLFDMMHLCQRFFLYNIQNLKHLTRKEVNFFSSKILELTTTYPHSILVIPASITECRQFMHTSDFLFHRNRTSKICQLLVFDPSIALSNALQTQVLVASYFHVVDLANHIYVICKYVYWLKNWTKRHLRTSHISFMQNAKLLFN